MLFETKISVKIKKVASGRGCSLGRSRDPKKKLKSNMLPLLTIWNFD